MNRPIRQRPEKKKILALWFGVHSGGRMDGSDDDSATRGSVLLSQLDSIFISDPLIDELGFVHPSHLSSLHASDESGIDDLPFANGEGGNSRGSAISSSAGGEELHARSDCSRKSEHGVDGLDDEGYSFQEEEGVDGLPYDRTAFWCGDHKLAISMLALAPMYKSARAAFISIRTDYTKLLQAEERVLLASQSQTVGDVGAMRPPVEDNRVGKSNAATEKLRLEDSLMNYSRALVLINCDYASAWSTRKQIILSRAANQELLSGELHIAGVVLSCGPKSEETWAYRRWVINQLITGGVSQSELDSLLEAESKLVEALAERTNIESLFSTCFTWSHFVRVCDLYLVSSNSRSCNHIDSGLTAGFLIGVSQRSLMNYRAWRHRCWLVSQMSFLQVGVELHKTKAWAASHVADNCSFHYRRTLLLKLVDSKLLERNQTSFCKTAAVEKEVDLKSLRVSLLDDPEMTLLWKEEMDWIRDLIQRYIGREALWIHLRFLLFTWVDRISSIFSCRSRLSLSCDPKEAFCYLNSEQTFVDDCISACSCVSTEAGDRQRELAATYKLWLTMVGQKQLKKNGTNGCQTKHQDYFNSLEQLLYGVAPHRKQLWAGLLPNLQLA